MLRRNNPQFLQTYLKWLGEAKCSDILILHLLYFFRNWNSKTKTDRHLNTSIGNGNRTVLKFTILCCCCKFWKKKVAVLFIRTLFWSPAGLELMENNKWRFKSLITASWTVVVVLLLMATIACRRSPMCIATNSYPAPPNHFKYVRRNWGYFFPTFNALILTSTLPFTPCQNDKEISRSLFFLVL